MTHFCRIKMKTAQFYSAVFFCGAGVKKKLSKLFIRSVKTKWCLKWIPAIINHMYKTICSTERNSELRREMWSSVVNHLCNIHTHPHNQLYKACQHEELPDIVVDDDGKPWRRGWLDKRRFQTGYSKLSFSLYV